MASEQVEKMLRLCRPLADEAVKLGKGQVRVMNVTLTIRDTTDTYDVVSHATINLGDITMNPKPDQLAALVKFKAIQWADSVRHHSEQPRHTDG